MMDGLAGEEFQMPANYRLKSVVVYRRSLEKPFIRPPVGWWSRFAFLYVGGGVSYRGKHAPHLF